MQPTKAELERLAAVNLTPAKPDRSNTPFVNWLFDLVTIAQTMPDNQEGVRNAAITYRRINRVRLRRKELRTLDKLCASNQAATLLLSTLTPEHFTL